MDQTHTWAKELQDHRARMVAFAENPLLLESVPVQQNEGQELLGSKLTAKFDQYRAELLKQMPLPSINDADSRQAIELARVITESEKEPEESEEPEEPEEEEEDGEIVEEEEELACGVVARVHPTLDLSRPEEKRVATPEICDRELIHITDAAKSFLFMQMKHNANWSTEISRDFQATSRSVERMFAVTKDFLERNSQTRIEILSPLAVLHDIPLSELQRIWLEHSDRDLKKKAQKALKDCPKTRDVDVLHLFKVLADASEKGRKIEEGEKLKTIGDHLVGAGLAKEGKKPTKRMMEEALGKAEVKKTQAGQRRKGSQGGGDSRGPLSVSQYPVPGQLNLCF